MNKNNLILGGLALAGAGAIYLHNNRKEQGLSDKKTVKFDKTRIGSLNKGDVIKLKKGEWFANPLITEKDRLTFVENYKSKSGLKKWKSEFVNIDGTIIAIDSETPLKYFTKLRKQGIKFKKSDLPSGYTRWFRFDKDKGKWY